jgi:hypothetical protein
MTGSNKQTDYLQNQDDYSQNQEWFRLVIMAENTDGNRKKRNCCYPKVKAEPPPVSGGEAQRKTLE